MHSIEFMPKAWLDLGWFVKNDVKNIKKLYTVLENTANTPFDGLGQPELLKANYKGYWSRRINSEHRIVYKVEANKIIVFSLKGHYQ